MRPQEEIPHPRPHVLSTENTASSFPSGSLLDQRVVYLSSFQDNGPYHSDFSLRALFYVQQSKYPDRIHFGCSIFYQIRPPDLICKNQFQPEVYVHPRSLNTVRESFLHLAAFWPVPFHRSKSRLHPPALSGCFYILVFY